MFKYLISLLSIFFIQGLESGFAQSAQSDEDSVIKIEVNDSSKIHSPAGPLREVPQKQVNSYFKNQDYAYANDPGYWYRKVQPKPGILTRLFNGLIIQWIIFIFISGILLYGIYQLARENNLKWLSRLDRQSESGNELPTERVIDYENLVLKCQLEGNYRLAVRYLYLGLIQAVREKGMIQIRDSSTNADMVRAFTTHPGLDKFRFLATAYENVYYGDFSLSLDLFNKIKNRFDDFHQILSD